MPTIAEVTGTSVPDEVDGISILPTLIGEKAAGHAQAMHDYLYWEHLNWKALRQNDWTIVASKSKTWELYNLSDDPGQTNNLADRNPEKLKMQTMLAVKAHQTQRQGAYETHELDTRDKRSK